MGALHDGHRSLIARAKKTCDTVVVSIFVNPLQFEPSEDFGRYPRDLSKDLAICRKEKADAVFIPQWQNLYPHDFQGSPWIGMSDGTYFSRDSAKTVPSSNSPILKPFQTL